VLYQRDYLQLLVKYGLESPSQLATGGARAPAPGSSGRPVVGQGEGGDPGGTAESA
jgi:hypothetical protein